MVFVRVYSGKLDNNMTLNNTNIPGNIGIIIGLKQTRTGDTLIQFNDSRKSLRLKNIDISAPVFFRVVEADSEQTLISGIGKRVKAQVSLTITLLHENDLGLINERPILGFPIPSLCLFGVESTKTAISACASQALTDALK
ncbi:17030_t:CDS:2, partial [Gigaspora rosea]